MAIKTPEKLITKSHGKSNRVPCPGCKKEVCFSLFENVDLSPVAALFKSRAAFLPFAPSARRSFPLTKTIFAKRRAERSAQ